MDWYILVSSQTTDPAGKRRTYTKRLPARLREKLIRGAKLTQLLPSIVPPLFYGCDIHITTPIHHNIGIIDPDTRKFAYIMGPNG